MKAAAIGLLAIAAVLTACTPKSDVDKCVEAWDEAVKDVPDDNQKRFNESDGQYTDTKAEERHRQRLICMRFAGKQNE